MNIITDTSSMYTPEEGRAMGLTIIPSCTIIGSSVYRDHVDIDSEAFLKKIEEGAAPTTIWSIWTRNASCWITSWKI